MLLTSYWHEILVVDHIGYYYTMCETKYHVELSTTQSKMSHHIYAWWGPILKSMEPPLESRIFFYLVIYYRHYSCHDILLHVYVLLLFLIRCIVHLQ